MPYTPNGTNDADIYSPFVGVAELENELGSFTDAIDSTHNFDGELHTALAAARATSGLPVDVMEKASFDAAVDAYTSDGLDPISPWLNVDSSTHLAMLASGRAEQVSKGEWIIDVSTDEINRVIASSTDSFDTALEQQSAFLMLALRADSDGAPSTHSEAAAMGEPWPTSEAKELKNHANNGSWRVLPRREKPSGRRLHRLVWVYKLKRDGTAKARLCVQGCTMQKGLDFDQVFSQTLRYSSARALFAFAARRGCSVRSIDWVAAYLQGDFIEGESVYCHMPPGYEECDKNGDPMVCEVVKPIYGIPQSGRRLQRKVFPWMVDVAGLRQLEDSDGCVFVYDSPDGSETFAIGIYVDNLQIVHSAELDENGDPLDKDSYYHKFISLLRKDWEVIDEGPMVDLLAIEARYNKDGSITLHQENYVKKLVAKYFPSGIPKRLRSVDTPYSDKIRERMLDATASESNTTANPDFPELVKPMQERLGALLYLATSSRADIGYSIPLLCRAMTRPTPELIEETDYVLAYLARTADLGLTFSKSPSSLVGHSDASWEVRHSTSGWVVTWQGAAIAWGSRKQDSIALSSCEAEIIALSEAAKDMVYFRKLISGLDRSHITSPSELRTDNMGARDLSYNPEHHSKTKHVERRHFYVRDMVEKFEITVPFVRTANNTADFFTKPLKPIVFKEFRRIIMNIPDSIE